jgi:hypothetical protein
MCISLNIPPKLLFYIDNQARNVRKWSKADKKEYVLDKELVDKYRRTPLSSSREQSEPEESVKISVPNDYRYALKLIIEELVVNHLLNDKFLT